MSYYSSNASAPIDKGRALWSRMKDFGGVNMSISSLSVSSPDQDGDSENSTALHQSLVKFYATKTGAVPEWLEPPGSQHTPIEQYQQQGGHNQNYPYQQQQQQQQYQPSKRPSLSNPSSSLQDIYARRGSAATVHTTSSTGDVNGQRQQYQSQGYQPGQQGQQHQQQQQYNYAPAGRGPPPPQGGNSQQSDRMREKLRSLGRSQSQIQGGTSGEPAWRR